MTTTYTAEQLTTLSSQLLTHIETHLSAQFDKGRIQGTDYAQVYIAAVQSSMAQAQSFLLGKDISAGQVDLLVEQKLQAEEQLIIMKERHGINRIAQYT